MKYSATPLAALRQLERYPRFVGDAAQFAIQPRRAGDDQGRFVGRQTDVARGG